MCKFLTEDDSSTEQPLPEYPSKGPKDVIMQNISSKSEINISSNIQNNYLSNKFHLSEIYASIKSLERKLLPCRGFYAITGNSGIYLWEAEDLNKPLIDSTYKQILQPLTEDESLLGFGVLSQGGIYITPDPYSHSMKFIDMKQLNNPGKYLVTKAINQTLATCFLQSEYVVICCGNKTLIQYDLSNINYTENTFYYNEEGNYVSCFKTQNENIIIEDFYGIITLLDKRGNLLSVNNDSYNHSNKHILFYYIEIRPNIIISTEAKGMVINDITNPLHIIRTYIPNSKNTVSIISLRHKEGYFASGEGMQGVKGKENQIFRRIYYLEKDNLKATIIKEKVMTIEYLGICGIGFMTEIQLGTILFQIYCGINQLCIWNYAENFEEERISCFENISNDLLINFLPILSSENQ